jgi:uncharacterized protein YndB with AHSA1/START domain
MMTKNNDQDLVLERVVDVSPELVFKAWTTPKHLMPWFCPKPYRTVECEIDLKPGGKFFAQMVDPDGNKLPAHPGCYLEIVPNRKLVWTSALGPGYRPLDPALAPWFFTAVLTFEPHGNGRCKYTATAVHTTKEHAEAHEKMGFSQGWGKVVEQLVAYVKATPMN